MIFIAYLSSGLTFNRGNANFSSFSHFCRVKEIKFLCARISVIFQVVFRNSFGKILEISANADKFQVLQMFRNNVGQFSEISQVHSNFRNFRNFSRTIRIVLEYRNFEGTYQNTSDFFSVFGEIKQTQQRAYVTVKRDQVGFRYFKINSKLRSFHSQSQYLGYQEKALPVQCDRIRIIQRELGRIQFRQRE